MNHQPDPQPADEHIQPTPPDLPTPLPPELPAPAAGPRYCLRCHHPLRPYRLHDLEQPRCPDCRLPYNPADSSTWDTRLPARRWLVPLVILGLVIGYGMLAYVAIFALDQSDVQAQLGTALFLAVPFTVGALLGYLTRPGIWLALLGSLFAVLCIISAIFCMGLHGLFCGATLGVIFLGPALVGALVGWLLRVTFPAVAWDSRRYLVLLAIGGLPFGVDLVERHAFPLGVAVAEVRTEAIFPAPPRAAWDSIVFYEQVEHEPPWLLKLALPRPVRTEGRKAVAGDITRCVYEKGHLVKQVTDVAEGERLAFRVIEQHLHFERDVTLLDGAFLLEPLPRAQTRVVLTTRYVRHLRPDWLWEDTERTVIHTLHGHVLEGMRRRLKEPAPHYPSSPLFREAEAIGGRP